MGGFSAEELEAARRRVVDDVVWPEVRLLVVGINPGLWSAAANAHFARPGNRFWPALAASGLTTRRLDPRAGFSPEDLAELEARGIGLTNVVARASARADELEPDELRAGAARVEALARELTPRVVMIAGITAYRVAWRAPKAVLGRQEVDEAVWGGAQVWVVAQPSGLNAHATPPVLARQYAEVARAAGL